MSVSPSERECRRALTFLLNNINPTAMPVGSLKKLENCLDSLPGSYDVAARRRVTGQVNELLHRRRVDDLIGMEGQQIMPGAGFDDVRAEADALMNELDTGREVA